MPIPYYARIAVLLFIDAVPRLSLFGRVSRCLTTPGSLLHLFTDAVIYVDLTLATGVHPVPKFATGRLSV